MKVRKSPRFLLSRIALASIAHGIARSVQFAIGNTGNGLVMAVDIVGDECALMMRRLGVSLQERRSEDLIDTRINAPGSRVPS